MTKSTFSKFFLIFILALGISLAATSCSDSDIDDDDDDDETGDASPTASYTLTFNATWSETTHPTDFPPNPHFSPLVGAVHADGVSFWESGELASDGIKSMAETGQTDALTAEVNTAITAGTAETALLGSAIGVSPGSTSMTITVSTSFPLVTLTSMIAPSPDWFVGVDSVSLLDDDDNEWEDEVVVTLNAYDAGTDSGTTYRSDDSVTSPAEGISRLNAAPFTPNTALGTFTFTKQ